MGNRNEESQEGVSCYGAGMTELLYEDEELEEDEDDIRTEDGYCRYCGGRLHVVQVFEDGSFLIDCPYCNYLPYIWQTKKVLI